MATKCIAKVGDVVTFTYENKKSTKRQVTGRIIGYRDMRKNPVSLKTIMYHNIFRSRVLVTVQEDNGNIRSFYNEVMKNPRKLVLTERVIKWFSGKGCFKVSIK